MKKCFGCFNNPDLGLLIFRLFVGITIAVAHGWGKVPPPEKLVEGVGMMGFPLPIFFAWCVALSEFLGGLLIAAGLFTRVAAAFLGFAMAVAGFVVHANDPMQVKELAFFYLASCLLLIFSGAGKYSLDRILRKV